MERTNIRNEIGTYEEKLKDVYRIAHDGLTKKL